jgi:hypothetical protein
LASGYMAEKPRLRSVSIKVWRHHRRQSALCMPCPTLPWPHLMPMTMPPVVSGTHDEAAGS